MTDRQEATESLPEQTMQQILDCIYAHQKIAAVKIYRDATGEDLLECKLFVEQLTARLAEEFPDQFEAVPRKSHEGASIATWLFMAIAIAWPLIQGCVNVLR